MAHNHKGFTLIELLIVIAIILILIAIALPNFLEAQLRARVVRTEADMRSIGIAMNAYYLDFGQYPPDHDPDVKSINENGLFQLTSPIQYLTSVPQDIFNQRSSGLSIVGEEYGFETSSTGFSPLIAHFQRAILGIHAFVITSHGPNVTDDMSCNNDWPFCELNPCPNDGWTTYSPTNGTKSRGELILAGGEHRHGSYCIDRWQHILGRHPLR